MRAQQTGHRMRWVWILVGIYAFALIVRMVFLYQARYNPLYQFLVLDERSQHEVAVMVANGTLPPNAPVKAPFFSYALGLLYKLVGPDPFRGRFAEVFIASLAPVLVSLIGRRLFGDREGILAGILTAVYWMFVFFSAELLDVTLASVLYLLLLYLLIAVEDDRWWKWLLGGAILGLGAITRPNILAFAPVLAVMVVLIARRRAREGDGASAGAPWFRSGLGRAALLTLGTVTAIAPVTLRNVLAANERMLIAFFGGYNLYVANNPTSDGKTAISPRLDITIRHPGLDLNDPWVKWDEGFQAAYLYAAQYLGPRPRYDQVERFYYWLTWDYIRHHPRKFLSDTFKRFCWVFNAYEYPNNKDKYDFLRFSSLLKGLSWLHFGIIGPVGIVGVVLAVRRRPWGRGFGYYLAMMLALAVPGIFFVVNSRYRLPVVYLLMPAVGYAVFVVIDLVRSAAAWQKVAWIAGGVAGLMVLSNLNLFRYRPPDHPYLLFSLAGACGATDQKELMADTIGRIETALANRPKDTPLHPWAMTCLFGYFCDRGDFQKAAHYGWEMVNLEPTNPPTLATLVEVLARAGQQDRARKTLDFLIKRTEYRPDPSAGRAFLAFGSTFNDAAALVAAHNCYTALLRDAPKQEEYQRGLGIADSLLKAFKRPTTSTTTTATSPAAKS